jgi:hypothetical protein
MSKRWLVLAPSTFQEMDAFLTPLRLFSTSDHGRS